jgi:general stress protein 26
VNRQELIAYVRAKGDGIVATATPDGAPEAAYVAIAATDHGELVFDARPNSRKIANIRENPRVAVVIDGRDETTLQCEGAADIPSGLDRDRCIAAYAQAFPEFAESVASDRVVVVRITLDWARYGDYESKPAVVAEVEL